MKISIVTISFFLLVGNAGCMGTSFYDKTVEDIFSNEETQSLARAACEGDSAEVDRLIAQGANVNEAGLFDVTPLIWAISCEGIEFPSILANRAIDAGIATVITPVDPEFVEGLEALLKAGANPNQMIDGDFGPIYPGGRGYWIDRYTPILIAAEFRQAEILNVLLQYGGDPNARDGDHDHTALSLAFDRARWLDLGPQMAPLDDRQWQNFYVLLDAGADLSMEVHNGSNVVETASLSRPSIALDVLRKYEYHGDFDSIIDYAIFGIEMGYGGEEERREILEFLRTEKGVDIDAAWQTYRVQRARMDAMQAESESR